MESPIVYYEERIKELEKQLAGGLEREKIHLNRAFRAEKQLEIAVKALEEVIKENEGCMACTSSLPAEKALAKIRGLRDE